MIPVIGPAGIGKTRLLAELAATASHDGAPITYLSLRDDPTRRSWIGLSTSRPLVLLDDAEAWTEQLGSFDALSARVAGTNALVVVAMDDSSLTSDRRAQVAATDGAAVRPGPLDLDDIREIAGSYIGASADALPASLLESTGGVPRRIHRQVSEWALAEANRRLGAAASRAATGRSDLRSVESELAGNVVDLQLIQERARRYASDDRRADEPERSPFKGLASFEVGDADLFFGRERLVADLVARLAGASLLGVVGPSGEWEVLRGPRRLGPGDPERRAPRERGVGRRVDAAGRAPARRARSRTRTRLEELPPDPTRSSSWTSSRRPSRSAPTRRSASHSWGAGRGGERPRGSADGRHRDPGRLLWPMRGRPRSRGAARYQPRARGADGRRRVPTGDRATGASRRRPCRIRIDRGARRRGGRRARRTAAAVDGAPRAVGSA